MSLWDSVYSSDSSYFGEEPSILARESLRYFNQYRCKSIIELGCGQGRDTVFFARNGLKVNAFDLSKVSVSQLNQNIAKLGLEGKVKVSQIDLSKNFPQLAKDEVVDAVYSNLFFCMPFNDDELEELFEFAYDMLPEGGLHIFSVRNKDKDKSWGKGKEVGKDTCEINGFRVRFFTADEALKLNHRFRTLEVIERYEDPCSLILVFSVLAAKKQIVLPADR